MLLWSLRSGSRDSPCDPSHYEKGTMSDFKHIFFLLPSPINGQKIVTLK